MNENNKSLMQNEEPKLFDENNSGNKEFISKEDMSVLLDKKTRGQTALLLAQKALAESQSFDLDYRNHILHIFLKNKMSLEDSFDEETGEIRRSKR